MVKGETHGVISAGMARINAPYIGKFIRIQLPPERPDSGWFCGASNVWRVHEEDVFALVGARLPDVFVCEHQIEID